MNKIFGGFAMENITSGNLSCSINGYVFNIDTFGESYDSTGKMKLTVRTVNPSFVNGLTDIKNALDSNKACVDIKIIQGNRQLFVSTAYKIEQLNLTNEGNDIIFSGEFVW
jgi:hypothetical protein